MSNCSMTQGSKAGEAQTCNPSVSSIAVSLPLSHCAPKPLMSYICEPQRADQTDLIDLPFC